MNPESVARWTGIIATVLAVVVALLKEELQRWWRKPKLQAAIRLTAPDCHKTWITVVRPETGKVIARVPCYYLRIWIENVGNQRAEQVQVFASKLNRKQPDGTFAEVSSFLPMNLRWAHIDRPYLESLSPRMGQHCNVGYVADPNTRSVPAEFLPPVSDDKTRLRLSLEVQPNTGSDLLEQGTYLLELKIAASNSEPVTMSLELFVSGTWYDDETQMFSDGLTMREMSGGRRGAL